MRRLPLLVLALAAGCRPSAPETAPMAPDAPVVAVLPVVDETGRSSLDGEEFGNILASEWVKASGARVIRPSRLRSDPKASTIVDAAALARKAGADLVLACAVTDCDPYDPPRLGVRVQLLRAEPRTLSTKDLDLLLQSASWHKGPLAMTREGAGHAVKSFEDVYDARDPATRQILAAYAQKTSTRESELTAVQPRWLQFVSNQILRRAYGP